jgi:lipopolysaccharide/colanic/teichoic acid biosynthesis glycosyltransferase
MSRDWRSFVTALLLLDLGCLVLASWIGIWIHTALSQQTRAAPLVLTAFTAIPGLSILAVLHAYDPESLLTGVREYSAVIRGCLYGLAAVSLLSFVVRVPVSREWIGTAWVTAAALILFERHVMRRAARHWQDRDRLIRRTLVVGADAHSVALAAQLNAEQTGIRVVGFLDDYHSAGTVLLPGVRVMGRTQSLRQVAAQAGICDAIVLPQALPWETLNEVISAATLAEGGPRIHLSAGFHDLVTTRVGFATARGLPLLTVNKARLGPLQRAVKSGLDYFIAVVLLISFVPVLGVMAGWQWVRGHRRLIARRRVVGRSGTSFELLALRSSTPFDSPFLRKLPGLVNVLMGELAIVGPRPIDASESIARAPLVAGLRPGLTGPWREVDDPAEQAVREIYYVRAYSVALDLQVLIRRVLARLRRRRPLGEPVMVAEQSP